MVAGRLGDLNIQNLDFVGFRNTVVQARRAHVVGLPNVDKRLYVDLDIQRFSTTRADLLSLGANGHDTRQYQHSSWFVSERKF